MKIKKNSAFTLIETMVALVISVIAVAAIYNAYLFFNKSYQGLLDKAAMSNSVTATPSLKFSSGRFPTRKLLTICLFSAV